MSQPVDHTPGLELLAMVIGGTDVLVGFFSWLPVLLLIGLAMVLLVPMLAMDDEHRKGKM